MSNATKTFPVLAFSNGNCNPTAPRTGHLHLVGAPSGSTAARHPLRPNLFPVATAPEKSSRADVDFWDQRHRP